MPFDLYADFVKRTPFTPLAHAFAQKLAARHPRLRFRLRQLQEKPSDVIEVPPEAVAAPLKSKVEAPPPEEYWVTSFNCADCGGNVTWGTRLLHTSKGHKLTPVKISHKGIRRSWEHAGFVVQLGEPKRLKRAKTYSIAVTTAPVDFDLIFLLQLYKDMRLDAASKGETIVLPKPFDEAVDKFVERYAALDPDALDPTESPEELELRDQEKRFVAARAHLATELPKAMAKLEAEKKKGLPAVPK